MTRKLAGALAAGTLAVGILIGAAGTVLVHDATRPGMGTGDMDRMMQMMDMMDGGGIMPGESISPADHERHHRGDR